MTTIATTRLGIFGRLKLAGAMLRGLSLSSPELRRYFPGAFGAMGEGPTRSYSQVAAVYRCVRVRAESIAGLPMMVSTADDQVIESGPLVELSESPAPGMTGRMFWQHTSAYLDLFGKVHWVFELGAGARPFQVVPVAPVQMEPKMDRATGDVLAWKYLPAGHQRGNEITLTPEQVHTIIDRDFEDANPLCGLSPRIAVSMAISQYFKSDLANEASLDNGVEPGGALQMDGQMTEQQRNEIRQSVEGGYAGVKNRRRFLLLDGGLKWQQMGAAFSEMEFSELKRMSRTDICAGFGVPPAVIGYYEDSNYAHADAADRTFWSNTILPLASRLAEEWNLAVLDRFGDDRSLRMADAKRRGVEWVQRVSRTYRRASKAAARADRRFFAWFDASDVPAVQKAALEQTDQLNKWWTMGVPLNQLLRASDAPFQEVPYGDVGYKPIGLEPYGADPLAGLPASDDDKPPAVMPELEQESATRSRAASAAGAGAKVDRATEAAKARLWSLWRKSWQALERTMDSRVRAHFFELRSEALANLDRLADQLKSFTPDQVRATVTIDLLIDWNKAKRSFVMKVGNVVREGVRLGGEQTMQEAADATGKDPDTFRVNDPAVAEKLRNRLAKVGGIDDTLKRRLGRKLAEAVSEGKPVSEISEALKQEFNFARSRATLIARTEIGAAVEEGRAEGRKQAGVPLKSWLSSRKATGRESHLATEAATSASPIPADQDFEIAGTGVTCAHPRDPSLPPEHLVNCACTTLNRYPDDSLKAVLSRYAARGFLTYERLQQRDLKLNPRTSGGGKDATDGTQSS